MFYPKPSTVYQQFINEEQWSLANYFNEFDYNTLAIHPYYDWFWRRRDIYRYFGFQDFYFMNDFVNKQYAGSYITDDSLTKEII